ncbi:MAG: polysulfide reductase [Chloroflexota bacterium]|nr:MAG: polysulfide reductase [Chloroflexota bacterium]
MTEQLQTPLWGWLIVFYFFFGGIAGGAYLISTIVELVGRPQDRPIARMGYYIAFPLALVCAVLLIVDLGRPERFWHMIVYRKTLLPWPVWDSAISVGAYALLLFGLFSFLSFLDVLVETGRLPWAPLRERYSGTPRRIYALLGAGVGFFVASYTGVLISTTHLPMWSSTSLLGALFLASGASTGLAAIAIGLALTKTPVISTSLEKLRKADSMFILIEIILLIAFIALAYLAGYDWSILNLVLLIGVTLIIGLIVPLVVFLGSAGDVKRRSEATIPILAALLILAGGFVMRAAIIFGGQGLI